MGFFFINLSINPQQTLKMKLSYWEQKNWFSNIDFTIVGSGIVGLHCALNLRERFPDKKILILEKGILPEGASTKNAGFACFGSLSEIISDLKNHSEQEVIELVQKRKSGLELLRKRIGDAALDYKPFGGYELFLKNDEASNNNYLQKMPFINDLLQPVFKSDTFTKQNNRFGFEHLCEHLIFNPFEGQIDTGKMMNALLKQAVANNILVLNNTEVTSFSEAANCVEIALPDYSFTTSKLFFATNGFASKLTNNQVRPARAQVLITEPIENLGIKGTFHLEIGRAHV